MTGAQKAGLAVAGVAAAAIAGVGLALVTARPEDFEVTDDQQPAPAGPETIARAAGQPLARYCLARAIASEEGGQPRSHQVAVGCALVNFARSEFPQFDQEAAVIRLVLGTAGAFGRQGSGGRRVSSARAPYSLQFTIAREILAGQVGDPTGGATQWDSPSGQRALLKQGDPLTKKTPEQVADARLAQGYELVTVPGIDPDDLRFWRKA